ncbi:MAG: hypothetical protein HYS70_04025 [Nitrospinae bacterium]|nr:hypothetical protein [Nitrospinota bacterium]
MDKDTDIQCSEHSNTDARNWITSTRTIIKGFYDRLGSIEIKKVAMLLGIVFMLYYSIEGFGRTVIAEFRIPEQLQKDLKGVDSKTLTHQLIVELENIRTVQTAASTLQFNLVKGLKALSLRDSPQEITLSDKINTDYNGIIENVDAMEWGAIHIPASLLLRPFQRLIRQHIMHISLQRKGNSYLISASTDGRGVWQATEEDLMTIDIGNTTSGETLPDLIRVLTYKIASFEGSDHQTSNTWVGFYHFHQGVRHLVEYFGKGGPLTKDAMDLLDRAIKEFACAISFNPKDYRSEHNRILASLERAVYVNLESSGKIDSYTILLQNIKELLQKEAVSQIALRNLLIANYILLAEAYFSGKQYCDAILAYERSLKVLSGNPELRAYILNNIGSAYQERKRLSIAVNYFRKALTENPRYPRAQLNLGNISMYMEDFATSERSYIAVINQYPEYANAFYNLGALYYQIRQHNIFQKLDQKARQCLQEQEWASLNKYVILLEIEAVNRDLSKDEKERLQFSKQTLVANTKRKFTHLKQSIFQYENCLARYVKTPKRNKLH